MAERLAENNGFLIITPRASPNTPREPVNDRLVRNYVTKKLVTFVVEGLVNEEVRAAIFLSGDDSVSHLSPYLRLKQTNLY